MNEFQRRLVRFAFALWLMIGLLLLPLIAVALHALFGSTASFAVLALVASVSFVMIAWADRAGK